jgi:hypothetical protein
LLKFCEHIREFCANERAKGSEIEKPFAMNNHIVKSVRIGHHGRVRWLGRQVMRWMLMI